MKDPRLTSLIAARLELRRSVSDTEWNGGDSAVLRSKLASVEDRLASGQLYEPNF